MREDLQLNSQFAVEASFGLYYTFKDENSKSHNLSAYVSALKSKDNMVQFKWYKGDLVRDAKVF